MLLQVTMENAVEAERTFSEPDGRGRRAAPRVHPAQRQGRPLPRHLTAPGAVPVTPTVRSEGHQ
nr:hypothetical protein [Angustibacter aerolatus]